VPRLPESPPPARRRRQRGALGAGGVRADRDARGEPECEGPAHRGGELPGFPTGIQGPDLIADLRAQGQRFGAELVPDDVTEVDLTGDIKRGWTGDEQYGGRTEHTARAVILATGSAYRRLGVPGEDDRTAGTDSGPTGAAG